MLLSELPDELLQLIAASLDETALSEAQLSCRGWRGAFGRAVLRLHPRQLPPGTLPRRFPNLQSLDLSRCVGSLVTDAAVQSLSALTLLTALGLKGCSKVSSDAVRELQTLAMLERLDLSGCKSLTSDALAVLPSFRSLCTLRCDNCIRIADEALAYLPGTAARSSLQDLSLVGCLGVRGPGLEHLSALRALTTLNLSGLAQLSDEYLAPLARLPQLRELVLDRCCGLTGVGLGELAGAPELRTLSLLECQVVDGALGEIAKLQGLTLLTLDYCQRITDGGLAALGALPSLRTLNLRGCEAVRGHGFVSFQRSTSLSSVNLSWCPNLSSAGMHILGQVLTSVTDLNMARCGLTNRQAEEISGLTRLRSLTLGNSPEVTCGGLEAILRGCRSITRLDVSGCPNLGDRCLAAVARLPQLACLSLNGCKAITNSGVSHLARASALTELNLAHSSVSDVASLAPLRPHLAVLNLFGCKLGAVPDWAAPGSPHSVVPTLGTL